jgi:hypothetical protein
LLIHQEKINSKRTKTTLFSEAPPKARMFRCQFFPNKSHLSRFHFCIKEEKRRRLSPHALSVYSIDPDNKFPIRLGIQWNWIDRIEKKHTKKSARALPEPSRTQVRSLLISRARPGRITGSDKPEPDRTARFYF